MGSRRKKKSKKNSIRMGEKIIAGLKEAVAFAEGKIELRTKNLKLPEEPPTPDLDSKPMGLKENFGNPQHIMSMMAEYMKSGDVASITDLISAYISNSKKYKNQDEFAEKIGTTRQTLHRLLSHSDSVSVKYFFRAIEQIHTDATE